MGNDVVDKALVVNSDEATSIRTIFTEYLALGSVRLLNVRLDEFGVVSKRRRKDSEDCIETGADFQMALPSCRCDQPRVFQFDANQGMIALRTLDFVGNRDHLKEVCKMVEPSNSGNLWPSVYQPFVRAGARFGEWLTPASEASSDESAYNISVELPGVDEEDVTIDVHDGLVSLKGEKREEKEEKRDTWYFRERSYGSFSRTFRLPPDADGDKVRAIMKDGVLTITVPKSPADAGKKQVKISKG